jgi:multidrug efflux pump subunit AcrA (membrane-fusion protein)
MKATFHVAGFDPPFDAVLTQVSASIQPDGRTLRVRMLVANPDGRLKNGLFAEGEILADGEMLRPALSSSVLTTVGRDADVFVADKGIARRRRILVGQDRNGWRSVDGLPVGMQIVAQGRDLVSDGSPLQIVNPSTRMEK